MLSACCVHNVRACVHTWGLLGFTATGGWSWVVIPVGVFWLGLGLCALLCSVLFALHLHFCTTSIGTPSSGASTTHSIRPSPTLSWKVHDPDDTPSLREHNFLIKHLPLILQLLR